MGNVQSVEVGEELTASSSQSKDCDLTCSVQLVDSGVFCVFVCLFVSVLFCFVLFLFLFVCLLLLLLLLLFAFPRYISGVHHFWVRFLRI